MRTISRTTAQRLLAILQLVHKEDTSLQGYLQEAGWLLEGEQYNLELEEKVLTEFRDDVKGVTNAFLEQCLKTEGIEAKVEGILTDYLIECPCCHSYSLQERAQYDICLVCWWEDDGTLEIEQYSSPNRQTLGAGRANFNTLGSSDTTLLNNVNQLPFLEKYPVREKKEQL